MEIRKAPNDTAALSFVANSEAARYVFVVVAAADVMDRRPSLWHFCAGVTPTQAEPGEGSGMNRATARP